MQALHVINTRPAERATALTNALIAAGYQVSEFPLLELQACPLDDLLMQQLYQIKQMQVVVVVSPTAAELGLQAMTSLGIQPETLDIYWIAVGKGTARRLAEAGIKALVPDMETSEGMLQLQLFEKLTRLDAKHLMIWRGYGGLRFMFDQLKQQGWQVQDVNLYRRQLPEQSRKQFSKLCEQVPDVLLISSGQSWQYWQQLAQQRLFYPKFILVLGQRVCSQIMQELNVLRLSLQPQVIEVADLQPASVLAILQHL